MKNLSVRKKIAIGFMLVTIIGVALGVVGIFSITTFTDAVRDLLDTKHNSDEVNNVLQAHYTWRQGITEAVATGAEFKGSLDPNTCALGNWLNSPHVQDITDKEVLSLIDRVIEPHNYIHNNAAMVIDRLQAEDLDEASNILALDILPKTQEVISLLTQMNARYEAISEDLTNDIIARGVFMTAVISVFALIALVIAIMLTFYISGMISKPLTHLTTFMKKAGTTGDLSLTQTETDIIRKYTHIKDEIGLCIGATDGFISRITNVNNILESVANGDLTSDITLLSNKDSLGLSMQKMTSNLNDMFGEIHNSTAQVSMGAKQVADGAQSLAQGSTQQAASVEELSSAIAEIAEKTKENAAMANRAVELANNIKSNAEKGSRQMDEMRSAVAEINQSGLNISKVMRVIDDIAFQTNILALNAAVEAARAGQHGKGFAVVAEEVRNLAAKSAEAAKDTGGLIANSIDKAELGSRIAEETSASFAEIVSGISENARIVKEIASSSDEQAAGISQINLGIDQVAQVVHHNSATAEESAAASEEMSSQSNMLEELISQFKLKGDNMGYKGLPPAGASAKNRLSLPEKETYMPSGGSGEYGKY